ncbi:MAG TPA: hypothetical protein VD838_04445, partial [Anaeromyxobacteraceae bacterium]|nr:hypothetical protein [Anaeromyxobacteraceae bacterium]
AAAIRFAASGEVLAVSVAMPGHQEERAYRDGAFVEPYLRSARDGSSFAVRRDGGWPAPPTVYVDEAEPPRLTAWDTLYEIDFTAQPSQDFHSYLENSLASSRTVAIAGLAWEVYNGSASTYGQRLVAGVGVQLHADGRIFAAGQQRQNAGASCKLALSQLAGYDPAKATAVLCRITGNASGGGIQQAGAALYRDAAWTATTTFSAARGMACHFQTGSGFASVFYGLTERTGGRAVGPSAFDRVVGVVRAADGIFGYGVSGPWSGDFPAIEVMEPIASGLTLSASTGAQEAAFIVGSNSAPFGTFWTCTHMRVLQRAAT